MFRSISRTLALLLAVIAAALVMVAPPASAGEDEEYPPPEECAVAVDDDSPEPGDTITISGSNWEPGATATILVGGAEVGTATVGEDGTWTFEHTIPNDMEPGVYEVTADGCESGDVLSTTITVTAPAAAAPAAIPRTGSSSTEPLVRTGAVLIAAGAVLVYAVRRRHQAATS